MEFGFSDEQSELRATVRRFFASHATSTARALGELDKPLWTRLAGELGLTALGVDERCGGFGGSLVDVAVAVEEAGRALLALPFLSTVATSVAVPYSTGAAPLFAAIAEGRALATLAIAEAGTGWRTDKFATTARGSGDAYVLDGVKEHVMDGDIADLVVVAASCDGEPGLFGVTAGDLPRDRLRRERMTTVDLTRPVARVVLDNAPAIRLSPAGDGGSAVAYALDVLHTLLAVESIGVATASLELTAAYLMTREQFGVPLSTFQALRHRVADLVACLEAATSTAWYSVRTGAAGSSELPVTAPMAKLVAADAAYRVTAESIQLHGGIGFTWEHPAHRYFKRATVTSLSYGDAVALRRNIAARANLR